MWFLQSRPLSGLFSRLLTASSNTVTLWLGALIFYPMSSSPLPQHLQVLQFSGQYLCPPSSIKLEGLNPEIGMLSLPNLGQKSRPNTRGLATKLGLSKQVVTPIKTPYSEPANDRQGGPLDSPLLEIKPF